MPITTQGEQVAGVLESLAPDGTPLYPTVAILMPRRSTKTTSIWNVLLGRCYAHPGYKVVTTAQDGIRARNKFREVQRALDAFGFKERGLGKLYWGNGFEAIEWANGSRMWVVPPDAAAFRSEAADCMLFDEAGELDEATSEDLVAGALPLMDTRPMGQVIITGTPSPRRAALLWDTLQEGRDRKKRDVGIVDYSLRDDEPSVLYPDGEDSEPVLNEKLLYRVHPGIGTLTTIKKMRARFAKMTLVKFEAEYFCRFPTDHTVTAINPAKWDTARAEVLPVRPDRVGLAFDVAPDSSAAALVAAWRDEDGRAHIEVIGYRSGVAWLPGAGKAAAIKHRCAVAYDVIGANTNPADTMHRSRVQVTGYNIRHQQGAQQRFVDELDRENLTHYDQTDLNLAAEGANWRNVNEGGRLFGRKASASDVSPIVAAALALWQYDQVPDRQPMKIRTTATR
ncbi:hypothetical protein EXU48_15665 [Occultella glacieicola]|uniref:Terminase n=1 Tax=Occultella glacieicola TaxID=2518684 RepID=A0ABY2E182_9MICO|nr:hypothetical protein [Occultella glacieicola]TDE91582.1 hypothetical protein EXU48_15665 [Occultella glacieicola]